MSLLRLYPLKSKASIFSKLLPQRTVLCVLSLPLISNLHAAEAPLCFDFSYHPSFSNIIKDNRLFSILPLLHVADPQFAISRRSSFGKFPPKTQDAALSLETSQEVGVFFLYWKKKESKKCLHVVSTWLERKKVDKGRLYREKRRQNHSPVFFQTKLNFVCTEKDTRREALVFHSNPENKGGDL